MRKRFGHALRLGIAADAVALVHTRRWGREPRLLAELPLDTGLALPAALAGAVATLIGQAGAARWPLTVVLADELARLWQLAPPAACTRMADLEAAAALRFQQLYGEPAGGWQISADWQLGRPFLAAALPRAIGAALQQATTGHAMQVIEVAPQFVVQFNRWRGQLGAGDWFGVVHDGVLTVAADIGGGAGLGAVRAIAIGSRGDGDGAWLDEELAREALRLDIAAPTRLLVCGAVPPAWRALDTCMLLGAAAPAWSPAAQLAWSGSAP